MDECTLYKCYLLLNKIESFTFHHIPRRKIPGRKGHRSNNPNFSFSSFYNITSSHFCNKTKSLINHLEILSKEVSHTANVKIGRIILEKRATVSRCRKRWALKVQRPIPFAILVWLRPPNARICGKHRLGPTYNVEDHVERLLMRKSTAGRSEPNPSRLTPDGDFNYGWVNVSTVGWDF